MERPAAQLIDACAGEDDGCEMCHSCSILKVIIKRQGFGFKGKNAGVHAVSWMSARVAEI